MSPVAFHSYRSIQTTIDLNGPTIDITANPSNVVTQPSAFQTPFGPATGALPIRNTDDAGAVALDTFRTDANKDQLVLAMPFNNSPQGGDVSALVRGSGTNKNTTDYGDAAVSTDQSIFYGASYKFDGSGDYVFADSNPDFAFGTGDFCVEFWMRRSTTSTGLTGNAIIQSDAIGGSTADKWFIRADGNTLQFNLHSGGGDASATFSTATHRWYHVAITRQSNTLYMFGNGRLLKTVSGYSHTLGQNGLSIGGISTPYYFSGYLQGVRIYKGVAKYTSDFVASFPTPDLVSSSLVGISTFIATSSVTLGTPNAPGATVSSGDFIYQWYEPSATTPKLSDGTNITGTATTTLTLSNLSSPTDNGRSFYLDVGYASGTYSPTTYRGVGNAINGPLQTSTALLTVIPEVTITTQPVGVQIGQGEVTTFTSGASSSDTSYGDLTYYWTEDTGDGTGPQVIPDEGRKDAITGNYASGATTPTLEMKKMTVGVSTIQFNAYQDAEGYRVNSKSVGVAYTGVLPRSMVEFEAYDSAQKHFTRKAANIGEHGAFTLDSSTFGSTYGVVQFFSPEENYDLRMTISASKGADNGNYTGGGGGKSVIDFRLLKNIEYTLIGVSNNSSIFLYRGAQLMAVVGQGGDAGLTANGGAGGGINMAGESGDGKDGGTGGLRVSPGNFNLSGQWGSVFSTSPNFTRYPGDIIAAVPNGGRTISCSRGTYWVDQGIGACEDNSTSAIKYRFNDGTEVSGSSEIIRGFKPGYTVTETSGLAISNGGNGGNGATGGEGGVAGSGGGGGSGYSDDTFDLKSSELGGSTSTSSTVKFEIAI